MAAEEQLDESCWQLIAQHQSGLHGVIQDCMGSYRLPVQCSEAGCVHCEPASLGTPGRTGYAAVKRRAFGFFRTSPMAGAERVQ